MMIGDELFLYTTRGAFKNPTLHRGRIIGRAIVSSAVVPLERPMNFGGREFHLGCDIGVVSLAAFGQGIELSPAIGRLQTFAGTGKGWAVRLRRPLVQITEADAALIRSELQGVAKDHYDISEYARWYVPAQ
ncbi:hypothetical protein ACNQR9_08030 [Mycolicibacterium peregrinum]|uniref:hypothetical protein n=1 Tax=Mycolicibacterium peregrinum TaxID=43304 RepID=UPI003AAAB984